MAVHRRIAYTIPAGGFIPNILAGTVAEFVGRASQVKIMGVSDTGGDNVALTRTLGGDSSVLIEGGTPLPMAAAAGQGPKEDEDGIGAWPVAAGSHLIMSITGTAANTGRIAIDITP